MRLNAHISRFIGFIYSSKLVKTIFININDKLTELFKPITGSEPKLIHVSPLYANSDGGKVTCIYSYVDCGKGGGFIKCNGPPKPVLIDGEYFFYIGFHEKALNPGDLLDKLMVKQSFCTEFMSQKTCIEIHRVDLMDANTLGLEVAKNVLNAGGLKVVFSSPTVLRDPLRIDGKYKSFIPNPMNVFATPLYTILNAEGLYTVRRFRRELLRIHRLLNETYSVLGGIRVKWVYYGKKPEPTLVGYVNYRVKEDYLDFLKKTVNVEEWLGKIFAYTIALGVGAGRASGFGHVELKPIHIERNEMT